MKEKSLPSQLGLMSSRRFWPLFWAQFLAAFNHNVFKNALVILITYRVGAESGVDPRLLVTAAAGLFILPFFLFSATAGQLADAHEKARLIRIVKFAEIPLMLLAGAGLFFGDYVIMLAVLFLVGTQAAFFGPLKYGVLPELLNENELVAGNGLIEAGTFIAILTGTIAGGLLVLRGGGLAMVAGSIALTALCGFLSARLVPPTSRPQQRVAIDWNIFSATWKLAKRAAERSDVFLSILAISWFWLVGFTFLAQIPVYANNILRADESVVTLFLTLFSIGVAAGSLVCNKMLKGKISGAFAPFGALGMAASIALLWLATPSAPVHENLVSALEFARAVENLPILLSLFLIAAFGGIYIVPLFAIMQTRCPPEQRARTVAVNNIMNALFMTLGAVFTMLALKFGAGVMDVFIAVGALNLPAAFFARHLARAEKRGRAA